MIRSFFVFLFCFLFLFASANAENLTIRVSAKKKITFDVAIAQTGEERAKGLMNRTSLSEKAGMLFLFPDERHPSFWMKDTLIPLDMIFIGRDGKIEEIHKEAQPLDLTPITPQNPVRAVLEIGGGMAEKLGLRVGDPVSSESLVKSLELQ